jgi:hypothetical protein
LADLQNPPHKWHGFRIFAHTAPGAFGVTRRSVVRIHSPTTKREPEFLDSGFSLPTYPLLRTIENIRPTLPARIRLSVESASNSANLMLDEPPLIVMTQALPCFIGATPTIL